MIFPVVERLSADGFAVATCCALLRVSTSGFYDWRSRPASARVQHDAVLLAHIKAAHGQSRGTYGSPRVHAELRLGLGIACGRKRVERLMREAGLVGISRRRRTGCTRRDVTATPSDDLVDRRFAVDGPDRLWVADITQHRTTEGWLYGAFVLDAWSRRVLGWSLGDRCSTELVADALDMALWRRQGADGCIHHSDHGCQYTSWAFGHRLRAAGLRGSMGSVGDAYDNAMAESFFASLQTELLDRKHWTTRGELAQAIFDYVEAFYNPIRRHSSLGMLSPNDYEHRHDASVVTDAA
jgi:putative transposase